VQSFKAPSGDWHIDGMMEFLAHEVQRNRQTDIKAHNQTNTQAEKYIRADVTTTQSDGSLHTVIARVKPSQVPENLKNLSPEP
jgi:hypothetical protein